MAQPTPPPLAEDGKKRTVILDAVDLAMPGTLRLELRAVEDGSVLKSAILRGTVADSIRGEGDAPGQPVRDVLDRVDDALKAAEATRKELETALGGVQGAVDAATEAAAAAEETDAQIQAAEQGRVAAEKKREQATAAAVKSVTDTVTDVQNKLESGAFTGAPGAPGAPGKDGKDAPQIDDTTVSDAAPWSSQHIVDMLCPPLEASGNPVVCYPVVGSTLGIKASWEPTQEGEGTPYPAGGGPNLLDISQCTATVGKPYGLTITIDGDIIKASGIPSSEVTEEGDYSFAVASCAQAELRGKGYKVTAFAVKGEISNAWGLRTEDESSLVVSAKLTPGVNTDVQFRLMVSKDAPVAYAPYANIRPISGRTQVKVERCGANLLDISQCTPTSPSGAYGLTITVDDTGLIKLSGIPKVKREMAEAPYRVLFTNQVISVKNYKAKAFVVKGTVTGVRTIASDKSIVIVTPLAPDTPVDIQFRIMYYVGNEPSTYSPYTGSTTTLTLPSTIYGGEVDAVTGEGQETWAIDTKSASNWRESLDGTDFVCVAPYTNRNNDRAYSNMFDVQNLRHNGSYYRIDKKKTGFATIDDLRKAIGATPVQIAYRLATPIPFTATGGGAVKALSGTNTILTDADALTVTGRADPIHIIQQLQAATAASAQAIADVERAVTDI